MFDEASPTPPKEGLPVIAEGAGEMLLFVLIMFCFYDVCKPPLWEGVGGGPLLLCSLCLASGDGYHVVHVIDRATA